MAEMAPNSIFDCQIAHEETTVLYEDFWKKRYFVSLQSAYDARGTPAEAVYLKLVDHYQHMHEFVCLVGQTPIPRGLAKRWMGTSSPKERSMIRLLVDHDPDEVSRPPDCSSNNPHFKEV